MVLLRGPLLSGLGDAASIGEAIVATGVAHVTILIYFAFLSLIFFIAVNWPWLAVSSSTLIVLRLVVVTLVSILRSFILLVIVGACIVASEGLVTLNHVIVSLLLLLFLVD